MEGLVKKAPSAAFWSGKRVLLTGHTGFKGTWCALWLKHLGAEVTGLALPPPEAHSFWEGCGQPGHGPHSFGDIRDPQAVGRAFAEARPEIVLHMAAQPLVQLSYAEPADTLDTNVVGLARVLDEALKAPDVRAVVNVTSDKCYENREQIWAYREDEPMGGSDPYSASKGCAELVTTAYRRSFFKGSKALASGRAGNVIGGGDWARDRLIPDCVRAFREDRAVVVRNRLATRPWQHVLEPVCGYLVLAERLWDDGQAFAEGWNFGPVDDGWPVWRVVDRLIELWGGRAAWRQDSQEWNKESMLLRVDPSKAKARLGWHPALTTDEALAWTVEWYKAIEQGAAHRSTTLEQIQRYQTLLTP